MDIMLPKKTKVLCLHEVSCNSVVMDYQIDSFKQKFIDYIEFVSLDAPFECTDECKDPVISKTFSGPYLSWFGFSSDRKTFVGYDKSLEYIISFMNTYGPFEGIFAFGQGINMATSLMGYNSKQGYKLRTKLQEKPKFAVLFNSSINRFLISDTFKPLPKYWIDDFDVPSYYSLVSKYNSSNYYCSRSILGYDISHSIVKFANMLWGQNRIRVSQSSSEYGEVEVIYEIHLDDFTHFNAKGTKSYSGSQDACIDSIYGKFLGKHVTLNLTSQFEYRMFSNMNLYSGACRPSID